MLKRLITVLDVKLCPSTNHYSRLMKAIPYGIKSFTPKLFVLADCHAKFSTGTNFTHAIQSER